MIDLKNIDFENQIIVIEYISNKKIVLVITDNDKFQKTLIDYPRVKNQLIKEYIENFKETDRFYDSNNDIYFDGDFSLFSKENIVEIAHIHSEYQEAELAEIPKGHLIFINYENEDISRFEPLPRNYVSLPGTKIKLISEYN